MARFGSAAASSLAQGSRAGVLTVAVLLTAEASVAQQYTVQELPPLPGYADSFAEGITADGTVIGLSRAPGTARVTRWVGGVPQDMGGLANWTRPIPLSVSPNGRFFTGEVLRLGTWVPFVWEDGTYTELPSPAGMQFTGGWGVNDSGTIAGRAFSNVAPAAMRACMWTKTGSVWTLTELPPAPGLTDAGAWGINQAGVIAGASLVFSNWSTAKGCLWSGGALVTPPPFAGITATLDGVNNVGGAVGDMEVTPGGVWHATYFDGATLFDLGTGPLPNSYAHRVNSSGVVVGQTYDNGVDPTAFPNDFKEAFVWRAGVRNAVNNMIPPGSNWDVKQLWDINDDGLIVGYGRYFGLWRACLLTPVCYADCDTSTGVNVLDIFDFLCFQNRFAASATYACECDFSTGPGVCDIFDFLCFQNAFAAGCP